ncbi:hypothetical protein OCU04_004833 [Sclerotinia nivalis]|uniref:Uncharacterized protein n=1 Tax=Sclerotinia nivalis TaxID=352851 RepID=A0A9X0DLJ4_9HELO|nr:hypothetical protein OCU04_004833 [Sclerotinia nivalis]
MAAHSSDKINMSLGMKCWFFPRYVSIDFIQGSEMKEADQYPEPHITSTIPAAFNKFHITLIHGNTTSEHSVQGRNIVQKLQDIPKKFDSNLASPLKIVGTKRKAVEFNNYKPIAKRSNRRQNRSPVNLLDDHLSVTDEEDSLLFILFSHTGV